MILTRSPGFIDDLQVVLRPGLELPFYHHPPVTPAFDETPVLEGDRSNDYTDETNQTIIALLTGSGYGDDEVTGFHVISSLPLYHTTGCVLLHGSPGFIDHLKILLRPGLHLTVDQDPPVAPTVDGMAVLECDGFDDHSGVTEDIVREILIGRADYNDEVTGFHLFVRFVWSWF